MKLKKTITIITIIVVMTTLASRVFAVSPTPTVSNSASPAELQKIEQIKDMVASRVAELKLVGREGILGTASSISNTTMALTDDSGNTTEIDIDELTQFADSAKSNFGISDIKSGDEIAAVGLYNKDTKRLLARTITEMHSLPVFFEGEITDKDIKNYTVTAVDDNGKSKILNIDISTKIETYAIGDDGASKGGFSKIQVGQRVFGAGFTDLKNSQILNVSRLIYFTDLPPSAGMLSHANISITPTPKGPSQ